MNDYKMKLDDMTENHELILQHLHDTLYKSFTTKFESYYNSKLANFNSYIEQSLKKFDKSLEEMLTKLNEKFNALE